MKMLENLSLDAKRLVIGLPYRIGYFISQSDHSGGEGANEAEQNALRNIVTFYVEDTVKSEFSHEVMFETLKNKEKWDNWKQDIMNVPTECQLLNKELRGVIDEKEIVAFKQNLLEIAIVVAQAYCEIDENSIIQKIRDFFFRTPEDDVMRSISKLERAAIIKLANDLSVEFNF